MHASMRCLVLLLLPLLACSSVPSYLDPVTKGCYDGPLVYSPSKPGAHCPGKVGNSSFGLDEDFEQDIHHAWIPSAEPWECNPPPLEVDGKTVNSYCKNEMACADESFKCGPPNAQSKDKYCWDYWDGWSANLPRDAPRHENVQRNRGDDLLLWPPGADCSTPRILFIHGGSWTGGGPNQSHYSVHGSKIAKASGMVVMMNDYPLAPMGNYQSIQDWSAKSWQWLARHGPHSRRCPEKSPAMFLAGDSSGGGTAFSLMLRLLSPDPPAGPKPLGYIGESPWLNLACDTPSYYSNAFAEIKMEDGTSGYVGDLFYQAPPGKNTLEFAGHPEDAGTASYYCGGACGKDGYNLQDPYASPYWATDDMLAVLPPLYFVVSATETVGGDSVVLANRAATLGVHVVLDQYTGMWHTFPQWSEGRCDPDGHGPLWQGQAAIKRMGQFLRQVAAAHDACGGGVQNRLSQPQTLTQLLHPPSASNAWVTVSPLRLELCARPPSRLLTLAEEEAVAGSSTTTRWMLTSALACVSAALLLVLVVGVWDSPRGGSAWSRHNCDGPATEGLDGHKRC